MFVSNLASDLGSDVPNLVVETARQIDHIHPIEIKAREYRRLLCYHVS